ncbi:MAG: hypothetical protein ACOX6X_05465 [Dethiobacteria bacterium]|jgi:hypothetical protein
MGKKYNKGRKQKPNYSKRGIKNVNTELGEELSIDNIIGESSGSCGECAQSVKKNRSGIRSSESE